MQSEIVGKLIEIWRYPVKSMGGESLKISRIDSLGLCGDRGWAVRDEQSREIRGAKKFPSLMRCSSKYSVEPGDSNIPPAEICFPDGSKISSDSGIVNERISQYLGSEVSLFPRLPESQEEHYRRKEELSEPVIRQMLGLHKNEPIPDLSVFPDNVFQEISEFSTMKGTYFDAYPIHLLTTSWLKELENHSSKSAFETDRFRPNLLIESNEPGLVELAWCGETIQIGTARFNCEIPTIRCSMTTHETGSLPRDIDVLKTIVKETGRNVGVYASIFSEGQVSVGDDVKILRN